MAREHIVVAEDEKHARLSLALILRQAEFRVTMAEDGLDALAKIEVAEGGDEPVDLLLTDIQMPRMNGLELIDRLRSSGIDLPVVGITGFGDKELVLDLLRRGCNEYLDKPFRPQEVVDRVVKVLRRERNLKAAQEQRTALLAQEAARMDLLIKGYTNHLQALQQFGPAAGTPRNLIDFSGLELNLPVALRDRPLTALGGDFVDIQRTSLGYDFMVAEVAGRGPETFATTLLLKAFFAENGRTGNDGETLFKLLNRQLRAHSRQEHIVTATFLRLDLTAMEGQIVAAGHAPLIQLRGPTATPRLRPAGESMLSVLGLSETIECSTHRLRLLPGDRFFLFTDGIYEAARVDTGGGRRDHLGLQGLCHLVDHYRAQPLQTMVGKIWQEVLEICENRPHDDLLLLGLEVPNHNDQE